jgi:hypothetical protein
MGLPEARREILEKSRSLIEAETAYKWADRAVAAWQLHADTDAEQWLRDAVDYLHEAVEHAALADHSGTVLREVHAYVHQYVPRGAI